MFLYEGTLYCGKNDGFPNPLLLATTHKALHDQLFLYLWYHLVPYFPFALITAWGLCGGCFLCLKYSSHISGYGWQLLTVIAAQQIIISDTNPTTSSYSTSPLNFLSNFLSLFEITLLYIFIYLSDLCLALPDGSSMKTRPVLFVVGWNTRVWTNTKLSQLVACGRHSISPCWVAD